MEKNFELDNVVPVFDADDLSLMNNVLDPTPIPDNKKEDIPPKEKEEPEEEEDNDIIFEESDEAVPHNPLEAPKDSEEEAEENEEGEEDEEGAPEDQDAAYLKATVKVLDQKGIIWLDDDEKIESWEDLDKKVSELPERIYENLIDQAPDLTKKILDFAFTSGKNITKEELKDFVTTHLEDLSTATTEIKDVGSARDYLKKVYQQRGLRPSAIEAALDSLEDEDDTGSIIQEEANKELQNVQSKSKADQLIQNKKELTTNQLQQQQLFVDQVNTVINNAGWKPRQAATIKKQLSEGITSSVLSTAAKSPQALVQLATLASTWNNETKSFDLSSFVNQAAAKEVKNIKNSITQDSFSSASSATSARNTKNVKRKGNLLDQLRPIG